MIARELYALQRQAEELERRICDAPMEQQEGLRERLRKVRAERDRMRDVLEGAKETPPETRLR